MRGERFQVQVLRSEGYRKKILRKSGTFNKTETCKKIKEAASYWQFGSEHLTITQCVHQMHSNRVNRQKEYSVGGVEKIL